MSDIWNDPIMQAMIRDAAALEKRAAQMDDKEFSEYLMNECLYQLVRKLKDGVWIGLSAEHVMGHYVIAMGLDATGWRSQYWYKNGAEALHQFLQVRNGQQIPENWTARRPK